MLLNNHKFFGDNAVLCYIDILIVLNCQKLEIGIRAGGSRFSASDRGRNSPFRQNVHSDTHFCANIG